jgi:hypothetical protein
MGFADDLLMIHRVITRALQVAQERGQEYAQHGFGDAVAEKGYRDFSRCALKLLHAHHDGEEAIIFPKLRPLLASCPFGDLEAQHREIVGAIDAANAALDDAEGASPAPSASAWLDRFVPAIGRVRTAWHDHIAVEEAHITQPAVDEVMDGAAQANLAKTASEHGQKNAYAPQLGIAFLLYNLAADDRAQLLRLLPPQLVSMVEGPWKEQWAPMKPLLLE